LSGAPVPVPYDRLSGEGAKVGQLFGVCTTNALSGADKRCPTVASGNLLIGAATAAIDNATSSTIELVRLNGFLHARMKRKLDAGGLRGSD
jgi:hypothetical protein